MDKPEKMKIFGFVQYIAKCIAAISAGLSVCADNWPTHSPDDDEPTKKGIPKP